MIIINKRTAALAAMVIPANSMTAYALLAMSHTTFKKRDSAKNSRTRCHDDVVANYPFGYQCDNANGSSLSRGHRTCIGCHSNAGTDMAPIPHSVYNHSDADASQRRYL